MCPCLLSATAAARPPIPAPTIMNRSGGCTGSEGGPGGDILDEKANSLVRWREQETGWGRNDTDAQVLRLYVHWVLACQWKKAGAEAQSQVQRFSI